MQRGDNRHPLKVYQRMKILVLNPTVHYYVNMTSLNSDTDIP